MSRNSAMRDDANRRQITISCYGGSIIVVSIYMTYQGLLADHQEAAQELRQDLVSLAALAHKKMFDLSELNAK